MSSLGFNEKVWAALRLIPKGKVATYKEIARYLGRPKAARAVGNACNKNPHAPEVPCHRVVRSDGRLGGYAGGFNKKEKLLRREGLQADKGKIKEFEIKKYKFR